MRYRDNDRCRPFATAASISPRNSRIRDPRRTGSPSRCLQSLFSSFDQPPIFSYLFLLLLLLFSHSAKTRKKPTTCRAKANRVKANSVRQLSLGSQSITSGTMKQLVRNTRKTNIKAHSHPSRLGLRSKSGFFRALPSRQISLSRLGDFTLDP